MHGIPRNATLAARSRLPAAGFVCRSCRQQQQQQQQRRQFSSNLRTPPPPPPAAGFAALPSRRLISVAGPDAAKFLQGVITANIASAEARARETGFYAAFLNATGRVLHDVFVYPDTAGLGGGAASGEQQAGTRFLIEADANEAERLAKHIKRYKLRAKFDVRLLAVGEATVWHAWDDSGKAVAGDAATLGGALTRDPRTPGLGYRLVRGGDAPPPLELEAATEDSYTIRRYLQGVAEGQDEIIREHALPQETNMDHMGGIDYHKGCYVGQELTIRTKHRGVVRKRVLPCVVYGVDRAAPRTLQYRPEGEDGDADGRGPEGAALPAETVPRETSIGRSGKRARSAGKWLKGVGNVGLALCRLEIMTDVVLPGETAASTFDPADEFMLQWGEDDKNNAVKIKAFVPEWLRNGLNETPAQ